MPVYKNISEGNRNLLELFMDIQMFDINYLAIHQVQMRAGATSKLLFGFASLWAIIHSLKLVDYNTITYMFVIPTLHLNHNPQSLAQQKLFFTFIQPRSSSF